LVVKNIKLKIYRTITLPVVLYGSEAWSPTLRVSENRVMRKIFASGRDEVKGDWKTLHNEKHLRLVILTKYY
jgi:hypothetical protein